MFGEEAEAIITTIELLLWRKPSRSPQSQLEVPIVIVGASSMEYSYIEEFKGSNMVEGFYYKFIY